MYAIRSYYEYSTCGLIAITNVDLNGALPSSDLPAPVCGNYDVSTNDLWYYITVPDGVSELAFHAFNAPVPMEPSYLHHKPAMAVYSGECNDLMLLDCFEESGSIIRITSYNVCYTKLLRVSFHP